MTTRSGRLRHGDRKTSISTIARKYLRIVAAGAFIFVWIGVVYGVIQWTKIQHVVCVVDGGASCDEAVIAELQTLRGKSLLLIRTADREQKLQVAMPNIETLQFDRVFPNTLRLRITLYPKSFYLSFGGNPPYYAVNKTGVVLALSGELQGDKLLCVESATSSASLRNLVSGEVMEKPLADSCSALSEAFAQTTLAVRQCEYRSPDDILCVLNNGRKALFRGEQAAQEVATLQQILNDSTMNEYLGVIDVRFAHPVFRAE